MPGDIQIRGARVHNLKNIDIDLPRNKLIVITGVSGSGKSSLAFDTLYAEGQRRYMESLSSYARQFLDRMDRPDVDEIRGISPAVAIEQKNTIKNSRSTVATATEIHDYLRLLFARIGKTYCPKCGKEVIKDSVENAISAILQLPSDSKIQILFPLPGRSTDERMVRIGELKSAGFQRYLVASERKDTSSLDDKDLARNDFHIIVDRLKVSRKDKTRLADSLDLAFHHGEGNVAVLLESGDYLKFSARFSCARCGIDFITPQPRLFSFNNPFGACPACRGFGEIIEIDLGLVIPDESKSLFQGAIVPWNTPKHKHMRSKLQDLCIEHGIEFGRPWRDLPQMHKELIINGNNRFPGIYGFFRRLDQKKYKIGVRVFLSRFRAFVTCPDCDNTRLRAEANFVRILGKSIGDVGKMNIESATEFFSALELTPFEERVATQILQELRTRLEYLVEVGLGYLTLDRRTQTLSGGEYQRINLATSVGFKLTASLYVLDEPSIGLHPRDNQKLISLLKRLRDLGNTVVVVEHDREMMEVSDYLVDLGPSAGELGGELVFCGTYQNIIDNGAHNLTAQYLKGLKAISVPAARRPGKGCSITIRGAGENNLKHIDVEFPLGKLIVVSGVSGSGKSTLVHDVLYAGMAKHFGKWQKHVGRHDRIEGVELVDDIVLVDQSPIGRTPRSNPVTYTKAFDGIRKLFAATNRAQTRNYKPGYFSFNTPGGRCEKCEGAGEETVEMQFLADVRLTCDLCRGNRYRREVLDIRYRGKNIAEVLQMTITEAVHFFENIPAVVSRLRVLEDVGLGYLRLGQSSTTLSGGEAQRIKLAAYLGEKPGKHVLYILDEPTTGLHFHDISALLKCFDTLLEKGNSLIVVEHNLDVLKLADHIIDLGPEGGEGGGEVVVCGMPEDIVANGRSYTAAFLRPLLKPQPGERRTEKVQHDLQ
jgi:excinuclease ABC subunit A